jgi:hypothetical protein
MKTMELRWNWAVVRGEGSFSEEVAETDKIGKCFHTGNMGFPLEEDAKDKDWLRWEAEIWMSELTSSVGMFRNAPIG